MPTSDALPELGAKSDRLEPETSAEIPLIGGVPMPFSELLLPVENSIPDSPLPKTTNAITDDFRKGDAEIDLPVEIRGQDDVAEVSSTVKEPVEFDDEQGIESKLTEQIDSHDTASDTRETTMAFDPTQEELTNDNVVSSTESGAALLDEEYEYEEVDGEVDEVVDGEVDEDDDGEYEYVEVDVDEDGNEIVAEEDDEYEYVEVEVDEDGNEIVAEDDDEEYEEVAEGEEEDDEYEYVEVDEEDDGDYEYEEESAEGGADGEEDADEEYEYVDVEEDAEAEDGEEDEYEYVEVEVDEDGNEIVAEADDDECEYVEEDEAEEDATEEAGIQEFEVDDQDDMAA